MRPSVPPPDLIQMLSPAQAQVQDEQEAQIMGLIANFIGISVFLQDTPVNLPQ